MSNDHCNHGLDDRCRTRMARFVASEATLSYELCERNMATASRTTSEVTRSWARCCGKRTQRR